MPDNQSNPFYNVMPEVTSGPLKKPVIQDPAPVNTPNISSKEGIPTPDKTNSGSIKFQKLFIFISIALIFIILGFVFYIFYVRNNETEQNQTEATTETAEQENPDVTTSSEWLQKFFGTETCTELVTCSDKADPDRDGLENKAEFDTGTDPNNNDSDSDGIADGDEALIFNTDPLLSRTYRNGEYNDIDFIKGGYDIASNQPYTEEAMFAVKSKVKQFGLHQPTLTSLGTLSFQLYEFTDPSLPPLPANLDISPEAKLDRDSQRQSTIKKVGGALIKFKEDKKVYPEGSDFVVMADLIKSYNTVATNYNDPVNQTPYTYGYQAAANNSEFTLTYYSETQNQLIKYTSKNAQDDSSKENTKAIDEQRKLDLENIQQALLVYSSTQIDPASGVENVFPPTEGLKSALIPRYITNLPQDPVSKLDYQYEVGQSFNTFTIKAQLQNPTSGTTGYMCNQLECKNY